MKTSYLFKHSNYLTRTAIVREQKQFIKIAFAVHLSAAISAERYRSDSGALKSAVLNFVFFILIKNKIEQSACQSCLKNNLLEVFPLTVGSGKTMAFENRWSRYKELGKKVPQAYRVYVEDTFLPCDAGDARIFSKEHEHGLRVSKHIFVGNSRLVTAMTHADNNGDTTEQTEKRYYYHADHLQSAQFITNARGEQYEHIEYTPYGELWIEEVAAGLDKLPFRFTGKELDEETGLYYYGARYLDPKYSRWLSGDPALGEYVPSPGTEPSKLAGMGGVYNTINLHVYHYSNNNPIRYLDPDGRAAGDLFDTMDAAAEDFGKTYNDDSIRNNVEYGTTLYKNKDGKYYYSVPNIGDNESVISYTEPLDPNDEESGRAHTHAAYDPDYKNNQFSNIEGDNGEMIGDIPNAKKLNLPSYLATPNGSMRKYTPSSDTDILIRTDMPSDPKDPDRLNKIDVNIQKDDPYNK